MSEHIIKAVRDEITQDPLMFAIEDTGEYRPPLTAALVALYEADDPEPSHDELWMGGSLLESWRNRQSIRTAIKEAIGDE